MLEYLPILERLWRSEKIRRAVRGTIRYAGILFILGFAIFLPVAMFNTIDAADRDFARESLGLVCVSPDQVQSGVEPVDLDAAHNEIYVNALRSLWHAATSFFRSDGDKLDEVLQRLDAIEKRLDSEN